MVSRGALRLFTSPAKSLTAPVKLIENCPCHLPAIIVIESKKSCEFLVRLLTRFYYSFEQG